MRDTLRLVDVALRFGAGDSFERLGVDICFEDGIFNEVKMTFWRAFRGVAAYPTKK